VRGGGFLMIYVKIDPSRPIDYFIRLFNKKVQADGILTQVNEKRFFMKPSQVKQAKNKEKERKIRAKSRKDAYAY
jgi:ribosomal protein S21